MSIATLKQLHISEFVKIRDLFMSEVNPHEDSMYVYKHEGRTFIIAFYDSIVFDLMELIE